MKPGEEKMLNSLKKRLELNFGLRFVDTDKVELAMRDMLPRFRLKILRSVTVH